jgi:uncharacterized protein (UPF0335 family)
MTDPKLKSLVERVKTLLEEQKAIGADITQAVKDARVTAPDIEPSMVRFAAREMLMDETKRNDRDAKRHQYLHAVGLAADMVSNGDVSLREAAKACGVSKSSVHRALAVPEVSQPEWTEADLGTFEPVREMTADDLGDPLLITNPFRARVKAIASAVKVQPRVEMGHPASSTDAPPDDLAIPPYLDRRHERVRG